MMMPVVVAVVVDVDIVADKQVLLRPKNSFNKVKY